MNKEELKNYFLTIKQILRYEETPESFSEYIEAKNNYLREINMETIPTIEQKPNISFNTFLSLDIRVCQVLEAERVPKTDKLLKLKINTGIDERECVTNLGGVYQPEEFVNKKIPFIINLEPTTIKKIESKAVIFIPDTKVDIFNLCEAFEVGENIFIK